MREILFRGKRTDNKQWVEGCYIVDNLDNPNPYIVNARGKYRVAHTTVGQYTGLVDKNGKRIFEGDIVHCVSRMDAGNMIVIFEEGEYRMVLCKDWREYTPGMGFYAIRCFEKEVIGNIHDNPGLLEAAQC